MGATWNSNATNANAGADRIAALMVSADFATSTRYSLAAADALLPELHVAVEAWPRFDDLDEIAAGSRARWQHKFGLGPFAPVFFIDAGADAIGAHDNRRTGFRGSAAAGWRKRLTELTTLSGTLEASHRHAREAAYDRDGTQANLEVIHTLTDTVRLNLSGFWRNGDVLSHATPPRPDLVTLAPDRLTVDTFGRRFVAYSIRAQTLGGRILLGRALSEKSEITLAYEYRDTERSGFRYVNQLVSLGLVHQF